MILLAIETSGGTCGATLCDLSDGFTLLSTAEVFTHNAHDAHLAQSVDQVLKVAGLKPDGVDVVAVSAGPGSFTGLRIGMSFAKGMCFDNTPKLMLIDTLSALAQASREVANLTSTTSIVSVVPSHRELFYAQRYTIDGDVAVSGTDHDVTNLLSLDELNEFCKGALVCGPGATAVDPEAISGLIRLSSRFIALRAGMLIANNQGVYTPSEGAEPLYRQEFKGNRP